MQQVIAVRVAIFFVVAKNNCCSAVASEAKLEVSRSTSYRDSRPPHAIIRSFMKRIPSALIRTAFAASTGMTLVQAIHADDGWVGNSGSPHLMSGHRTVQMKSERVVITVGRQRTRVSASFLFVNNGPATVVRMGFPDENEGQPGGAITGFRSWVNGRRVSIRHISGDQMMWYAKKVAFPAHSSLEIKDQYAVETGVARWGRNGMYHLANYTSIREHHGKEEFSARRWWSDSHRTLPFRVTSAGITAGRTKSSRRPPR